MALIGLISDVHASPEPLEEALTIFSQAGVDKVYCAGDIAGYFDKLQHTVAVLVENNVATVVGNHDLQYLEKHAGGPDTQAMRFLNQLPVSIEAVYENKKHSISIV